MVREKEMLPFFLSSHRPSRAYYFLIIAILLECPAGASAEERVQERLTGTASETTPQAKPVIMRPAYSMA